MLRFAVVALVALPCAAGAQQWDSTSVDTIAPGVVHRRVVANSGPWRLNVLEVDLGNNRRIVRDGKSVAEYADFVEGTFP